MTRRTCCRRRSPTSSQLGLERALEIGAKARRGQGIAYDEADLLLPYKPPSVRDFVTFESHVEGVRKSIDNAAGIPEAWYDAPTFYFTNPHALYGPGEPIPRPLTCRGARLRDGGRACVVGRDPRSATEDEARPRSSATRSSTTGRPATSSPARCRSGWARPRARTSPRRSARGSSPPTSCPRSTSTAAPTSTTRWSARTGSPTCTGPSRRWSPTPPATRSSSPATCSPPAPPAAVAAWPSCGAATASRPRHRSSSATSSASRSSVLGSLTAEIARPS